MHQLLDLFHNLTNPDWINSHGGLYIVLFIVFAETGLFVGFFLPGDSLLFITGMIISSSHTPFDSPLLNLFYWIILIATGAVIGNFLGYWFGWESGHLWFEKKDNFLFKRKHLTQAHDFYEKKGNLAIILGRFLPIVRTFAPLIAGIVNMGKKKFIFYSLVGALAWVSSMTIAGYMLGSNTFVKKNIELITIGIILVTTVPVLIKMFAGRKKEA